MDLRLYQRKVGVTGASTAKYAMWYLISELVFVNGLCPVGRLKVALLRAFGAKVGKRVVIKPRVRIKFPWKLTLGDDVWIGESAWIDNLAEVTVAGNVCISQGAYLCTGGHDYRSEAFCLTTRPIRIDPQVWVGAYSVLLPGVTVGQGAVIAAGSVVSKDLEPGAVVCSPPLRVLSRGSGARGRDDSPDGTREPPGQDQMSS